MISLELAKKLKDAGLEWKPKEGDYCQEVIDEQVFTLRLYGKLSDIERFHHMDRFIWLPSLSRLLKEIEKRHPNFRIKRLMDKWFFDIFGFGIEGEFYGNTPEEAAGRALLWILEQ